MAEERSAVDAAVNALNAAVIAASLEGARVHVGIYMLHLPGAPHAVPMVQVSVDPGKPAP